MKQDNEILHPQAKWYLIPTSFKPLGELKEVIIAEMDLNVTTDISEENEKLKQSNEALVSALRDLLEDTQGHYEASDEGTDNLIHQQAKQALQNNNK